MVAVKYIIAAIDTQYVKEIKEDYIGSKNQTIKTLVTQLSTWYVITTKEKLSIKAEFLAPWSGTPEVHVTNFVCQLDRH